MKVLDKATVSPHPLARRPHAPARPGGVGRDGPALSAFSPSVGPVPAARLCVTQMASCGHTFLQRAPVSPRVLQGSVQWRAERAQGLSRVLSGPARLLCSVPSVSGTRAITRSVSQAAFTSLAWPSGSCRGSPDTPAEVRGSARDVLGTAAWAAPGKPGGGRLGMRVPPTFSRVRCTRRFSCSYGEPHTCRRNCHFPFGDDSCVSLLLLGCSGSWPH